MPERPRIPVAGYAGQARARRVVLRLPPTHTPLPGPDPAIQLHHAGGKGTPEPRTAPVFPHGKPGNETRISPIAPLHSRVPEARQRNPGPSLPQAPAAGYAGQARARREGKCRPLSRLCRARPGNPATPCGRTKALWSPERPRSFLPENRGTKPAVSAIAPLHSRVPEPRQRNPGPSWPQAPADGYAGQARARRVGLRSPPTHTLLPGSTRQSSHTHRPRRFWIRGSGPHKVGGVWGPPSHAEAPRRSGHRPPAQRDVAARAAWS